MRMVLTLATLLAFVAGLVLPMDVLWQLIAGCMGLAACLSVWLFVLVARRQGRWAFALRGERAFVVVGVALQ